MELEAGSCWLPAAGLGLLAAGFFLLPAGLELALGLLLLTLCLQRLLAAPLLILRAPHQVGYIPEPGISKRRAANEVRRRRKKGELPPVYPNGWYRVLDSQQLQPGQVKNITIFVPEFAKIKTWPTCELNCAVFVWFHCDDIDPSWSIPEQEEIQSGEWVYRGRTEHFVNCHIQEIPENAADIAHLSHLHAPSMLSGSDLRSTRASHWGFAQHDWKVEWNTESEPNKHCSRMLVNHAFYIFGRRFPLLDVHVVCRQVGPGIVYMLFNHSFLGRGIILHCVAPVEPLLQRVTHSIYYQANIPAIIPKFVLKAECIQFERDVMIWNNKKYISKPLLVKEDSAIARHRRWYTQFYSQNSPRFTAQLDSLDW
ncbi:cholesterol 7-desaturase nvd isoform X2 [Scyliorhinus torazame]|uniref:cholesterol 7-desaturase nvd isoform X2 n=1 Tax=Scyliorhinus torazame TaxID=75743 RepID=UPI003B59D0CD